jgi:hypothetical protein
VYPISGRSIPITLTINVPSDADTTDFRCSYWDAAANGWSTSGAVLLSYVVQENGDVYASCGTLHLSDFSGVADPSFLALPNPAEFLDVGMLSSLFDPKNLVPVAVIFTLVGFFLISWALSFHQDRKLGDKMTALRRAHHLLYGQVTGGFGRDKLHLDMDERGKAILRQMEQSFRVRSWLLSFVFLSIALNLLVYVLLCHQTFLRRGPKSAVKWCWRFTTSYPYGGTGSVLITLSCPFSPRRSMNC